MSQKRTRGRKIKLTDLDYDNNDAIVEQPKTREKGFYIKNKYTLNDVHKSFVDICLNDKSKMVLVDGPAGTAKTYLAVLSALTLLKEKQIDQIVYIRSIVESATKSIGALPGEIDEKFKPWSLPMLEKMQELIPSGLASTLISEGSVRCVPVNFVRGLTFHDSFVIIDEAQNMTKEELITILTRFGHGSRYVVVGDGNQKDIGKLSGFSEILKRFNDEESVQNGIHVMKFGENEIVRSAILKFIVKKLGC